MYLYFRQKLFEKAIKREISRFIIVTTVNKDASYIGIPFSK